ncbi:DUF2510 domain-containing protein [Demequina sp. SYSU T00192]|uniref:DUF2510 domain-containing protein n=1 Tax=Demequina litoralis TaxID=3051660 RepID=A0ABT8G856_9MICO|nr:DUF2510 domain-containing protein [Demequina sp. SYSU T00192]MDN4475321.1 DUF2510 domain-containing protein [Demequina sp. SYSU T00192]
MPEQHSDPTAGDPFAAPAAESAPETARAAEAASASAPAGWYPDAERPGGQRYWDGASWTDQRVDAVPTPPRKRGRRLPWLIAGGVGAALGAGFLVYTAVTHAVESAFVNVVEGTVDATAGAADEDGGTRTLAAVTADGWTAVTVMDGHGSIAVDPAWTDVADVMGAEAMAAEMSADAGGEIAVDGIWLTAGDLAYGGTLLMVMSVADAGAASTPRLEVASFIEAAAAGADYELSVDDAIVTEHGYVGHISEFDLPVEDIVLTNTVGIVADGSHQLLVYATGTEDLGPGSGHLEAVLGSYLAE